LTSPKSTAIRKASKKKKKKNKGKLVCGRKGGFHTKWGGGKVGKENNVETRKQLNPKQRRVLRTAPRKSEGTNNNSEKKRFKRTMGGKMGAGA